MSRDDSLLRVADWHPLYCLLERGQSVSVHHSSWARTQLESTAGPERAAAAVATAALSASRLLALQPDASTSARSG